MTADAWFHLIEIGILLLGVAAPVTWACVRLVTVFRDFPPHLHVNGKILYPKGYEPPRTESIMGLR